MSNTKTEKYENISSRDYVPRYLKISRAETMSRLMGREHPAPKPFMDASIYFISRKDPKKKIRKKKSEKKKHRGGDQPTPPPPRQSWFIIMIQDHPDQNWKIWKYLVQRLCPEKSENISSRDYVQKNMKISRPETMSGKKRNIVSESLHSSCAGFHTTFDGLTH